MLFDTHVHLQHENFKNDVDEVIKKAQACNVEYMLINGFDLESSKQALKIAKRYENIYVTIGVHPLDVFECQIEDLDELYELAKDDKVVAIGEIGLDYYYSNSPVEKERQNLFFNRQLEIAKDLGLPVTIHSRDSIKDTFDTLKTSGVKGVMHCFNGSVEMAREFVKIGYAISISGVVTFKNAKEIKAVVSEIDLKHLLIETDAPYLTPVPHRGKRNEPAYVDYVATEIAKIKGIDYNLVAEVTTQNAKEIFEVK